MSPDTTLLEVPATACETIASPPSLVLVQFAPRLPFARLKSSEAVAARTFCGNITNETRRRVKTTSNLNGQWPLDREVSVSILAMSPVQPAWYSNAAPSVARGFADEWALRQPR